MGVSKNRGNPPKWDGENNGKPLVFNGWFGGTIIFGNPQISAERINIKKESGVIILCQPTQTRHFFVGENGTLKFTLHLHSLIPQIGISPENGLGQREGQN